jgi:hypothetical protein
MDKLKVITSRIREKNLKFQPLTPKEENLVAEMNHVKYLKPKEVLVTHSDGSVTSERSVELDAMFEAVRGMREIADERKAYKNPVGAKYVGSLDPITAGKWGREFGAYAGTKEFAVEAKKRMQSHEYAKFRGE